MEDNTNNIVNENSGNERATVVGVRFRDFGKVYYFSPGKLELERGDNVFVETVQGVEFATVTSMISTVASSDVTLPLKEVIRKATPEEVATVEKNRERESEALEICSKKIANHKLDMKLESCDFSYDGSRVTFYFTSPGRVDFRELVRDLASTFRTRIELRQIGPREKAKLFGGLGTCGRPLCCASFIGTYPRVSIKMAKDQNIPLGNSRVLGLCDKIMCCLRYEQDCYMQLKAKMPPVGSRISTSDGQGVLVENALLREHCRVKISLPDGTYEIREYPFSEIDVISTPPQKKPSEKQFDEKSDNSDDIPEE